MILKYTINNTYAKWFEYQLNEYINPDGLTDIDTERYLQKNGFFITFGFDRNRVAARKRSDDFINRQKGSVEFDNFNHFYNLVSRRLLGRHFMDAKLHHLRPFVIACADAQGTRYGRKLDEIENIHLHTLWALRPSHASNFYNAFDDVKKSREFSVFDFDEIDVRPIERFESKNGEATKLTSYMSKFLALNTAEADIAEDLRIYPRPIQ